MKNFQKFLEEVDLRGNPGIPGEGQQRQGEENYMDNVARRAMNRYNLRDADKSRMTPMGPQFSQLEMRLGRDIMTKSQELIGLCRNHHAEISELATNVIYNTYKEIIDKYEIELDIKLVNPRQVKQMMDESEESDPPNMREIRDEETKNEIHKRKIANLLIQGEAKNSKHMIHMEEVRDGLTEILGNTNGPRAFRIGNEITAIADKLDWIRIEEILAQMMEESPEGLAGACKVDWKPKETKESQEDEEDENPIPEPEDDEEDDDDTPIEGSTPILRARGIDFVMLFHEAVKGLFEILSLGGIPADKEISKKVISNTGISDEPQDLKYGPEVAADLRDFVNENPNIDKYPNLREELWKYMVDKDTMPTTEFLEFMRGILSKTPAARTKMDRLIDKLIKDVEEYKDQMDRYNREMDQYHRDVEDFKTFKHDNKKSEDDNYVNNLLGGINFSDDEDDHKAKPKQQEKEEPVEIDYSRMSNKQLNDELNDALDKGDYALATKISSFIKESLKYKK